MDEQMLDWSRPGPEVPPPSNRRLNRRQISVGAGLVAGGALVGAVLAGTLSAGAATTTPSSAPSSSSSSSSGSSTAPGDGDHDGRHGLDLTGTVTAVGSSSVTIKTSSGTTVTYAVNRSSDIDKNGEAQLSSLVAGDAVRYSVASGSKTIDKLHAGDEAKDMPHTPPGSTG